MHPSRQLVENANLGQTKSHTTIPARRQDIPVQGWVNITIAETQIMSQEAHGVIPQILRVDGSIVKLGNQTAIVTTV